MKNPVRWTEIQWADHGRIWRIAGPSIAANISVAGIGLVDTWAIGHLHDPLLLAAVGLGAFLVHFVIWGCGFLRMGTTGDVARAHGAEDAGRLAAIVLRAAAVGLGLGVMIALVSTWLIVGGLAFFQAAPDLHAPVTTYAGIRLMAIPAVLLKLAVVGYLIGSAQAGKALGMELFVNLTNVGLTILFVVVWGWGLAGAAWGSVLAELLAAFVGVILVLRLLGPPAFMSALQDRQAWRIGAVARSLSGDGLLILRSVFLLGTFALFWRLGAQLGTVEAGVNQVLLQFVTLSALTLDGIAYAAEAEVGRAVGGRDAKLYRRILRLTLAWSLILALITSGIYWMAGGAIVALFTDHSVIQLGAGPLLALAAMMPIASVWSYEFDGVFVGLNANFAMMATMGAACAGFVLLIPYIETNRDLWLAFLAFNALRGLGQALCLPWLSRRVFDR